MGPIIAGALAGGGEAGERVGLQAQKQLGEQDLLKMRAEAEQALARTSATLAQETHAVNTKTDIAALPERMAAETTGLKTREAELRPGRVAERKEFADVDTDAAVKQFELLDPLKRKSDLTAALDKVKAMATKPMLEATRNITLAQLAPSFTYVPNQDGSINVVDAHSGKSTGLLKDGDKVVTARDPEQVKAVTSALNIANTNLRIAEGAYKTVQANAAATDEEKKSATAEWEAAKADFQSVKGPAFAVLFGRGRVKEDAPKSTPVFDIKDRFKAAAPEKRVSSGKIKPAGLVAAQVDEQADAE